MTTLPFIYDATGRPLPLDRLLASGGEGSVYTVPMDTAQVVKVYHRPPSAQTVEKLTAMIGLANPQLKSWTAWPTGLVYDARTRQVAGFIMPRLGDCQSIQALYNPIQRMKCFPKASWGFQVRAAVNLAAAIDEVHKAGCLVGDINERNEMVSPKATITLIDCDTFQLRAGGRQFLCEVGVLHYTPPELQNKTFRGLVRTENHDRFGLAVLVYQLLFVGSHPYAGRFLGKGDLTADQFISEFRFAQGPAAHKWDMAPRPHTPTFEDIPADVATLFRRAFERGSETGTRPRPSEWITALKRLESEIVECKDDSGHKFWRGAKGCVWCRLAARGGPEFYFGVAGGVGNFAVDDARLREVLHRLAACQAIAIPAEYDRYVSTTRKTPQPLPPDFLQLQSAFEKCQVEFNLTMRQHLADESAGIQRIAEQGVTRHPARVAVDFGRVGLIGV